jgi:hypothetical protein
VLKVVYLFRRCGRENASNEGSEASGVKREQSEESLADGGWGTRHSEAVIAAVFSQEKNDYAV